MITAVFTTPCFWYVNVAFTIFAPDSLLSFYIFFYIFAESKFVIIIIIIIIIIITIIIIIIIIIMLNNNDDNDKINLKQCYKGIPNC